MDYPQTDVAGPLYSRCPVPPPRAVPTDDSDRIKDSNAPVRSTVTLSPPVKIEFGVTRVWVQGGGKASRPYSDGQNPPLDPDAVVDAFRFAPSVEEGQLELHIEAHAKKPEHLTGLAVELYGRDGARVHRKAWTAGELTSLLGAPDSGVYRKALPWSELGLVDGPETPGGFLTLARAPYQLRVTVTGKKEPFAAEQEEQPPVEGRGRSRHVSGPPPDLEGPDRFAYPRCAWTWLHVLTKKVAVGWGDMDWLPRPRPDLDPAYEARVVGAQGGAEGLEREAFRLASTATATPEPTSVHEVVLRSDLFGRKYKDQKGVEVDEKGIDTDFQQHAKLWGDGPRLPLVATIELQTIAGEKADGVDPRVFTGAEVLWDWEDPEPARWKKNVALSAASERFVTKVHEESAALEPRGSTNCPVKLGGKHGAGGKPVFLPAPGGTFPFAPGGALLKRTWGARTKVEAAGPQAGKAGVVFQPSRMAGDAYRVRATVWFSDELDAVDPVALPAEVQGSPGRFDVLRKITVHHVVFGDVPGIDLQGCRDKATTIYRDQVRMHLDHKVKVVAKPEARQRLQEGVADGLKEHRIHDLLAGAADLFMQNCLDLAIDSPVSVITFKDVDAVRSGAEARLRQGKLVPYALDKPLDDKLRGQMLRGRQTGATGYPIHLQGLPPLLLLADPNRAFMDGEQVVGVADGAVRYLTVHPGRPCTGTTWTPKDGGTAKTVVVKLPGAVTCTLHFKRKRFSRTRATDLSDAQKDDLLAKLRQSAKAFAQDQQPFAVDIERPNDDDGKARAKNIIDFLTLQRNKADTVIDKDSIIQELKRSGGPWAASDAGTYAKTIQKDVPRSFVLTTGLDRLFKDKGWTDPGAYVVHISSYSNLADLPQAAKAYFTASTNKDQVYRATRTMGAFDAYHEVRKNDRSTAFISLVTADPASDKTEKVETKPDPEVYAHEIGHALWLPHAYHVTGKNPGQVVEGSHVTGDQCLMNYDLESGVFCGLCMLRLRGWDWKKLSADSAALEYRVRLELDDVDALFTHDASTREGQMARLQALGLFNRPIHDQSLDRDAAFDACWKYAKALLPGLDGDPKGVLARELKAFLVDGGQLPAAKKFARLRCPGGYTASYSMSDLVHRYPDHHDTRVPNPEDAYALGADREVYEDLLYAHNPALGVLPLKVTVEVKLKSDKTGAWAPAADQEVFVGLGKPDPLPGFASDTSGRPLAGGKTFLLGVEAPLLRDKPKAYLTAKVDGHDKSPSTDPQAGNAHHLMGGQRRRDPKDAVGLQGGLFCKLEAGAFGPLPAVGDDLGRAIPHAVALRTDDQGVVRLGFRPTRIGGDRWRLEAFVAEMEQGAVKRRAEASTGTMVRWRTIRVCHYFKQDPPAALSADFKALADHGDLAGGTKDALLSKLVQPLEAIPFSTYVNEELARSYCELILDPGAEAPKKISSQGWTDFESMVQDETTRFGRTINKPSLCDREKVRPYVSYETTLTADGERKVFTGTLATKTPGPDMVYVRLAGAKMRQAILHDHLEPDQDAPSDGWNLLKLEQGTPVLGLKTMVKDDAAVACRGKVDYATGDVTVEFEAKQDKDVLVTYVADQYIDFAALYDHQATDVPGLFRQKLPKAYNAARGPDFIAMEEGPKPKQATFLTDRIYCPSSWVFAGALFRALEGNGQGYLPGLIIVQADHLDPYDALFSRGQEGKGMANGVLVFRPAEGTVGALALHELGHALFLEHAKGANGAKHHLHDPADGPDSKGNSTCLMSYSTERDGDHCGVCVANLRGLRVRTKPLRLPPAPDRLHTVQVKLVDDTGAPVVGEAVEAWAGRDLVAVGVTGPDGACALEECPKKVEVTFPGLDGREWDKV